MRGVYAYGKGEKRTEIVDGRARKSYGHSKPLEEWEVLLKDHHESYINWAEFERNQKQLAVNAYGKRGGAKSGRGGRARLAGLLTCGRCGRRLVVSYSGRSPGQPVYRCERPNQMLGLPRCFTFGGLRVDASIARELLRAVEPMAIEAALEAERRHMESQAEQRRILELELQQARYEASLAERRYAACDPDNRLIAAQLEKSWEAALRRMDARQARVEAQTSDPVAASPDFARLADDLDAAWNAPGVTMRARQRLLRLIIASAGSSRTASSVPPGRARRSAPNPGFRPAGRKGYRRDRANRSPVSRRSRKPTPNVSRCLKRRCTMRAPSRSGAELDLRRLGRGGQRAAAVYSLIATCKLNDVDPRAWLADVLARLPDHPAKRVAEVLPWAWKGRREAEARTATAIAA